MLMRRGIFLPIIFALLVGGGSFLLSQPVLAASYLGRMTYGGYLSQETHEPEPNATDTNDFATTSARLYLNVTRMGSKRNWELVADVRDKHDFFNKLDKERQELTDKNTLQLRQLSVIKQNKKKGLYGQMGRFHAPSAGGVFTDGAELGWRWSSQWRTALFGGLNPKQVDQSYLKFNPDASIYGLYLEVKSKNSAGWRRYFHYANALVYQTYKGEVDRNFIFQHFIYQWNMGTRISSSLYWDLIPKSKIQNGNLTYNQRVSRKSALTLSFLTYDLVEYRRRQELREVLEPSPYSQGSFKAKYKWSRRLHTLLGGKAGKREEDKLKKEEFYLGINMPRLLSKRVDSYAQAGHKKRFTTEGPFVRMGVGYFSRKQEYSFDAEWASEKQTDGSTLNPIILEANVGYHLAKHQFLAFSLQSAKDEKVSILGVYFKYSYRFGKKELPPIRDGASPRGRI